MDNNNRRTPLGTYICGILYGAFLVAAAYILGTLFHCIVIPDVKFNALYAKRFLIGCGCLAVIDLIICSVMIVIRIIYNRNQKRLDSMMVIQTPEELQNAGIQSPIDFCYLMLTTNFETPINILNGTPGRLRPLKDTRLYAKDVLLFKSMFGRNPVKADVYDWLSVSIYEMYTRNNKVQSDLTFEDMKQMVSPRVLSLPTRFCQEWDYEIQRQFEDRCQELAEDLQRRKKKDGGKNV